MPVKPPTIPPRPAHRCMKHINTHYAGISYVGSKMREYQNAFRSCHSWTFAAAMCDLENVGGSSFDSCTVWSKLDKQTKKDKLNYFAKPTQINQNVHNRFVINITRAEDGIFSGWCFNQHFAKILQYKLYGFSIKNGVAGIILDWYFWSVIAEFYEVIWNFNVAMKRHQKNYQFLKYLKLFCRIFIRKNLKKNIIIQRKNGFWPLPYFPMLKFSAVVMEGQGGL